MTGEMFYFEEVTSNDLLSIISGAKEKIIIAKPGFLKNEIEEILKLVIDNKVKSEIYIESGDQAVRFGFGDLEALKLINKYSDILNVQTVERIRMSIVIVDNKSLIFAPNISFMEEDVAKMSFPNGLIGDDMFTEKILKSLFDTAQLDLLEEDNKVSSFPGYILEKKERVQVKDEIEESIEELEKNPAVSPGKLRQVNFYRNNYKLAKIHMLGIKIKTKRINLKPFLSLLSEQSERLISSWNVFTSDDVTNLQDTILFENEMKKIMEKYLMDAKRFGYLLDSKKKTEFSSDVNKLLNDFTDYLKGEAKDENIFMKLKSNDESNTNISKLLKTSREELLNYLMKVSYEDNMFMDNIFKKDRNLKLKVKNEEIKEEKAKKDFIESFIDNNLKFPDENDVIDQINILIDYYDISDELIESKDFQDILQLYQEEILQLRDYGEGYEMNS